MNDEVIGVHEAAAKRIPKVGFTSSANKIEQEKKSMKKIGKILIMTSLSVMAAAMPITSYGWGFKKTETTAAVQEVKYEFKTDKATVSMGAEAAPVIQALGTDVKTFEQESCAYQGKDVVYLYKGFELSTYPVNGKQCIASIFFSDGTVSTPEGIKIGSTKQEVLKAYGSNYKEEFGVYHYTAGNTELVICTTKDVVDSIEYLVIPAK